MWGNVRNYLGYKPLRGLFVLCVFCNPPNLTFAIERMILRYFAGKTATIRLQDKGGRGSSFPRSLSLRSVSPHKKIFAMAKLIIF